MPLNAEQGRQVLQLVTSRYNDWKWRAKIEKVLSLPSSGFTEALQRDIFTYLKTSLRAYKSRRADPDTWIVGGFVTQEAIARAKFKPELVAPSCTAEALQFLGADPGPEVDEAWWEEMLMLWYEEREALDAFEAEIAAKEEEATRRAAAQEGPTDTAPTSESASSAESSPRRSEPAS